MSVPFLDLKSSYTELKDEIDSAVAAVLNSGNYILGPTLESFEEKFAAYCNAKHCIGVANGLDALTISLKALGVKEGDEVIVPSNTYIATWLAVSQCGAIPVPVEPCDRTYNMDARLIENRITNKTKAVIVVHLYGLPANLKDITEVARRNGLKVIEDAAQAHGATYYGEKIGSHSDAVAWSFYPGKNLGAFGDGGAVTTNCSTTAEMVGVIRNYGSKEKYINDLKGLNSRLDPLQAAVLEVKLKYLDEWVARRRKIARRYMSELVGCDLILPYVPDGSEHAWHLFVVRTKNREGLRKFLASNDIGTIIHYPIPPHRQLAYSEMCSNDATCPVADRLASEVLSLPIGPHLSLDQTQLVIDLIKRF